MVKIRLMRMGSKQNPHYRMVVVDGRKKRGSKYIESLGHYDPRKTTDSPLEINAERATYWLSQGAQPPDPALRLIDQVGVGLAPGLAFGEDGEGWMRLCFAADTETLSSAMDRLEPILG